MKNSRRNVQDLWDLLRNMLISGKLWPRIAFKDGNEFVFFIMHSGCDVLNSDEIKTIMPGDCIVILDDHKCNILCQTDFDLLYSENCKCCDFYKMEKACEVFGITEDTNKLFLKSDYKQYVHTKEQTAFDKMKELLQGNTLSEKERLSYERLIKARNLGSKIDFLSISDFVAKHIPSILYDNNVDFVIFESFVEEDIDEEQELNVEEIIRNDLDNVLVFMQQDIQLIEEINLKEQTMELIELSQSVDSMSPEELVGLKSRLKSLSIVPGLNPSLIAKVTANVSCGDAIYEQMKSEAYDRRDALGLDNEYDDYNYDDTIT